jgi:hypothetical protein|tara:strand:+ start:274 stop:450 length:177 start_codon:yes stop_codon:yes gene_type:complete
MMVVMENAIVFLLNLIVVAILTAAFVAFRWSGPGFAFGFFVGMLFFLSYYRLKHGRWP